MPVFKAIHALLCFIIIIICCYHYSIAAPNQQYFPFRSYASWYQHWNVNNGFGHKDIQVKDLSFISKTQRDKNINSIDDAKGFTCGGTTTKTISMTRFNVNSNSTETFELSALKDTQNGFIMRFDYEPTQIVDENQSNITLNIEKFIWYRRIYSSQRFVEVKYVQNIKLEDNGSTNDYFVVVGDVFSYNLHREESFTINFESDASLTPVLPDNTDKFVTLSVTQLDSVSFMAIYTYDGGLLKVYLNDTLTTFTYPQYLHTSNSVMSFARPLINQPYIGHLFAIVLNVTSSWDIQVITVNAGGMDWIPYEVDKLDIQTTVLTVDDEDHTYLYTGGTCSYEILGYLYHDACIFKLQYLHNTSDLSIVWRAFGSTLTTSSNSVLAFERLSNIDELIVCISGGVSVWEDDVIHDPLVQSPEYTSILRLRVSDGKLVRAFSLTKDNSLSGVKVVIDSFSGRILFTTNGGSNLYNLDGKFLTDLAIPVSSAFTIIGNETFVVGHHAGHLFRADFSLIPEHSFFVLRYKHAFKPYLPSLETHSPKFVVSSTQFLLQCSTNVIYANTLFFDYSNIDYKLIDIQIDNPNRNDIPIHQFVDIGQNITDSGDLTLWKRYPVNLGKQLYYSLLVTKESKIYYVDLNSVNAIFKKKFVGVVGRNDIYIGLDFNQVIEEPIRPLLYYSFAGGAKSHCLLDGTLCYINLMAFKPGVFKLRLYGEHTLNTFSELSSTSVNIYTTGEIKNSNVRVALIGQSIDVLIKPMFSIPTLPYFYNDISCVIDSYNKSLTINDFVQFQGLVKEVRCGTISFHEEKVVLVNIYTNINSTTPLNLGTQYLPFYFFNPDRDLYFTDRFAKVIDNDLFTAVLAVRDSPIFRTKDIESNLLLQYGSGPTVETNLINPEDIECIDFISLCIIPFQVSFNQLFDTESLPFRIIYKDSFTSLVISRDAQLRLIPRVEFTLLNAEQYRSNIMMDYEKERIILSFSTDSVSKDLSGRLLCAVLDKEPNIYKYFPIVKLLTEYRCYVYRNQLSDDLIERETFIVINTSTIESMVYLERLSSNNFTLVTLKKGDLNQISPSIIKPNETETVKVRLDLDQSYSFVYNSIFRFCCQYYVIDSSYTTPNTDTFCDEASSYLDVPAKTLTLNCPISKYIDNNSIDVMIKAVLNINSTGIFSSLGDTRLKVKNSRVVCVDDDCNYFRCVEGYSGNFCEKAKCFGKIEQSENVCNGGTCIAPNVCKCKTNYYGSTCDNSVFCYIGATWGYFECKFYNVKIKENECLEYFDDKTRSHISKHGCQVYNQDLIRADLSYFSDLGSHIEDYIYLRTKDENDQFVSDILTVPLKKDILPPEPEANLFVTSKIGSEGKAVLVGTYSKSIENRQLYYSWELVDISSNDLEFVSFNTEAYQRLRAVLASWNGKGIAQIEPQYLKVYNYDVVPKDVIFTIKLTVKNIFGIEESTQTNFTYVTTNNFPTLIPATKKYQSCKRSENCVLEIIKRSSDSDGDISTSWVSNVLKVQSDLPSALIIKPYTFPSLNESYKIEVLVGSVQDYIIVNVPQNEIKLRILNGNKSYPRGANAIITMEYDLLDFTTEEKEKYYIMEDILWTCGSLCPQFLQNKLASNNGKRQAVIPTSELSIGDIYDIKCTVTITLECRATGSHYCRIPYSPTSTNTKIQIINSASIPEIIIGKVPSVINNDDYSVFGYIKYATASIQNPINCIWEILDNGRVVYSESFNAMDSVSSSTFVINPYKLIEGGKYVLRLTANWKDSNGNPLTAFSEVNFDTTLSPDTGNCIANPQSGNSLITDFIVECSQFNDRDSLKFFFYYKNTITGGIVDISSTSGFIPFLVDLKLPVVNKIYLRVLNSYYSYSDIEIPVTVYDSSKNFTNDATFRDFLTNNLQSVEKLISSKGFKKAVHIIQNVLEMLIARNPSSDTYKIVIGAITDKIIAITKKLSDSTCLDCWTLYHTKLFGIYTTILSKYNSVIDLRLLDGFNYFLNLFVSNPPPFSIYKQLLPQLDAVFKHLTNNTKEIVASQTQGSYQTSDVLASVEVFAKLPLIYVLDGKYYYRSRTVDFFTAFFLLTEFVGRREFRVGNIEVQLDISALSLSKNIHSLSFFDFKPVDETSASKWRMYSKDKNFVVLTDVVILTANAHDFIEPLWNLNSLTIEGNAYANVTVQFNNLQLNNDDLRKGVILCSHFDVNKKKLEMIPIVVNENVPECKFDGLTLYSAITVMKNVTTVPSSLSSLEIAIIVISTIAIFSIIVIIAIVVPVICYYRGKVLTVSTSGGGYGELNDFSVQMVSINNNGLDLIPEANEEQTRYEILRKIGSGAFGSVFVCKDKKKPERGEIAMKLIQINKENINQALREAIQLAKLNHKHIIQIYESFIWTESNTLALAIVMPFHAKGQLRNLLKTQSPFSLKIIYQIWLQLMDVLSFLEDRDVIHRDIKLENVLVRDFSKEAEKIDVALCDFGVAKEFSMGNAETLVGTQNYMAPEIILIESSTSTDPYGNPADVFSLGCVIYQLFTNDTDTRLSSLVIQNSSSAYLKEFISEKINNFHQAYLSDKNGEELVDILVSMLKKNPRERAKPKEILARLMLLDI